VPRPGRDALGKELSLHHPASRPCLQLRHHAPGGHVGGALGGDNDVDMLGSYVHRQQHPSAVSAVLSDGGLARRPSRGTEVDGGVAEAPAHRLLESGVRGLHRAAAVVGSTIDRASVVAGKPGAVAAKGEQVGEWSHGPPLGT
jgi:hypothetical protein